MVHLLSQGKLWAYESESIDQIFFASSFGVELSRFKMASSRLQMWLKSWTNTEGEVTEDPLQVADAFFDLPMSVRLPIRLALSNKDTCGGTLPPSCKAWCAHASTSLLAFVVEENEFYESVLGADRPLSLYSCLSAVLQASDTLGMLQRLTRERAPLQELPAHERNLLLRFQEASGLDATQISIKNLRSYTTVGSLAIAIVFDTLHVEELRKSDVIGMGKVR